jgi:hypothetical protein
MQEDLLASFDVERTDSNADVTYELGTRLPSISAWLEVLAGPTLSWFSFPLQSFRGAHSSTILCAGFSLLALDRVSLSDSMALTSPSRSIWRRPFLRRTQTRLQSPRNHF